MNDDTKQQIIALQEKIQDLTEYLQSEVCKGCGDAAIQIDIHLNELSKLIGINTKH